MAALSQPSRGDSPLLTAALAYAARGWFVFPVHAPGRATLCDCGDAACSAPAKHPWTRNGLTDASGNEEQIRAWWRKWPRANIGVACGPSGLVVLDVDPRHGGDLALRALIEQFGLAPGQRMLTPAMMALLATQTSETGGGGEHYVYRMPDGATIRNATDLAGLRGLDVRAGGGYFIAPPSLHLSGAHYQWREGTTEPAHLPDWLAQLLRRRISKPTQQPVRMFPTPRSVRETGEYWLERALHLAHEGNRNDRGFWLACQLRDAGLTREQAETVMVTYAQQTPGTDYSEREALASLRSAYLSASREPARAQQTPPLTAATPSMVSSISSAPQSAPDEASAPRQRFQFLSDVDVENMPPPSWLISGYLVEGRLSVVFGEFGSFKSFLTMDWALCVATGTPWQGQRVKQGSVAYIAGEGIGGLGKRLRAWKSLHGWQGSAPLYLLGEAPQLLRREDVEALRDAIQALPETPSLIIIDTLARSMVGGDENSAQDMGLAVSAAQLLQVDTGAHVLLVHHKPAGASKSRGSTALPGAADTLVDVTKEGLPGQQIITISCGKQKDAAPFEAKKLRFRVIPVDESGNETSGALVSDETLRGPRRPMLTRSMQRVVSLLGSLHHGQGARRADLVKPFLEGGMAERSLDNGLNDLLAAGFVQNSAGIWSLTTTGEQEYSELQNTAKALQ